MKKFLITVPSLALALLLVACGNVPQPTVPETPKSVERALNDAVNASTETTTEMEEMEADELNEADVTVELDAALDALETDIEESLEVEVELVEEPAPVVTPEEEVQVQAEAQAEPETELALPPTDEEGQIEEQVQEEELIDQPIIIE